MSAKLFVEGLLRILRNGLGVAAVHVLYGVREALRECLVATDWQLPFESHELTMKLCGSRQTCEMQSRVQQS